ncbi:MAG: site-specific integrase [Bryobacteraceae bacterium]
MHSLLDPKLLQRVRVGPLAPYLDIYLARLRRDGFMASSVPCQAYAIARFSRWLEQRHCTVADLDDSTVREFLNRDPGIVHYPEPATLRRLCLILQEIGVLQAATPPVPTASERCVNEYRQYLVNQRGLSASCLSNYTSFVKEFLSSRFPDDNLSFSELCASDVTAFLQAGTARLARGRAKLLVTALRSFLRYLLHRGRIEVELAGCVPSVAGWAFSEIPKCLPAGAVERLLEQHNRSTALGQRNYAILLLLARLGLRAGEVRGLNLQDIDWENGCITIRRKAGRWMQLPLPTEVGEAVALYLRSGRPQCSSRYVFVRHRAPVRGFAHSITISSIVRRALIRAGIESERTGAHVLRHSLAADLLRKGASLEEIGDVLGHRRPDTTALYAKVDLEALRPLALSWPGGAQ